MKKLTYLFIAALCIASVTAWCRDFDNGIAPYDRGWVQTDSATFYDYCSNDKGTVTEFYCVNDTPQSQNFQCLTGCQNYYWHTISTLYPLNLTYYNGVLGFIIKHDIGQCNPTSPYFDVVQGSPVVVEPVINNTNETSENETNETEPTEPECSHDWQCSHPKHCIEGSCQFKHCCHDWQCSSDEFCAGNHCQDVVCHHGYVWNHKCVKFH